MHYENPVVVAAVYDRINAATKHLRSMNRFDACVGNLTSPVAAEDYQLYHKMVDVLKANLAIYSTFSQTVKAQLKLDEKKLELLAQCRIPLEEIS
jgi:hypothetical protein